MNAIIVKPGLPHYYFLVVLTFLLIMCFFGKSASMCYISAITIFVGVTIMGFKKRVSDGLIANLSLLIVVGIFFRIIYGNFYSLVIVTYMSVGIFISILISFLCQPFIEKQAENRPFLIPKALTYWSFRCILYTAH